MNIFSDLKKHALVAGESLSPNTNINSVMEKMKLYIMSNRMRSLHMQIYNNAMLFHLLYIPSISIVIKLTITNIGDKQQRTNIVNNNVITISTKYMIHM